MGTQDKGIPDPRVIDFREVMLKGCVPIAEPLVIAHTYFVCTDVHMVKISGRVYECVEGTYRRISNELLISRIKHMYSDLRWCVQVPDTLATYVHAIYKVPVMNVGSGSSISTHKAKEVLKWLRRMLPTLTDTLWIEYQV